METLSSAYNRAGGELDAYSSAPNMAIQRATGRFEEFAIDYSCKTATWRVTHLGQDSNDYLILGDPDKLFPTRPLSWEFLECALDPTWSVPRARRFERT
jgi:hypothetical protein